MTRRFMSHNPVTGITSYFEGDGQGGFSIIEEADIDDVLEHNTRHRNNGTNGKSANGEFWYAGEIPMITIQKWLVEDHIDVFNPNDAKKVKQRLNSNEWFRLRSSDFKL